MFHRFGTQGPSAAEIQAWCSRIVALLKGGANIHLVQVYSVARKPADASVKALPREELEGIAQQLRHCLGAHSNVQVFVY